MSTTVGLDIGGTKIDGGVVDRTARSSPAPAVRRRPTTPTRSRTTSRTWSRELRRGPRGRRGRASVPPASSTPTAADRAVRPQPRLARRAAASTRLEQRSACRSSSRTTPTPRRGASSRFGAGRDATTSCCHRRHRHRRRHRGRRRLHRGALRRRGELGHMRVVPDGRRAAAATAAAGSSTPAATPWCARRGSSRPAPRWPPAGRPVRHAPAALKGADVTSAAMEGTPPRWKACHRPRHKDFSHEMQQNQWI